MSRKQLSLLAASALVVTLLVLVVLPSRTGVDAPNDGETLLPGLEAVINAVDLLEVSRQGPEVVATLRRVETGWTVDELGGYPADFDTVREVLAGLARSTVRESKTANPEYFDRLGVEPLEAEGAPGTGIALSAEAQEFNILLGNRATSRNGRYARREDGGPALLTDFDADVPTAALGWVDNSVVDLGSGDVARVDITHPDGESLSVAKVSADDADFALEGLPDGRSLKSAWAVNGLAGVLSGLTFDDVATAADQDWSEPLVVTVLAFSGLQWRLELVQRDDAHWLRLSASAPYADSEGDETSAGLNDEIAVANARVNRWAYRIPSYKFDAMNKRLEDLLAPLEDADASGSG